MVGCAALFAGYVSGKGLRAAPEHPRHSLARRDTLQSIGRMPSRRFAFAITLAVLIGSRSAAALGPAGSEIVPVEWSAFGLFDADSTFRVGGALDSAERYFAWTASLGIWR